VTRGPTARSAPAGRAWANPCAPLRHLRLLSLRWARCSFALCTRVCAVSAFGCCSSWRTARGILPPIIHFLRRSGRLASRSALAVRCVEGRTRRVGGWYRLLRACGACRPWRQRQRPCSCTSRPTRAGSSFGPRICCYGRSRARRQSSGGTGRGGQRRIRRRGIAGCGSGLPSNGARPCVSQRQSAVRPRCERSRHTGHDSRESEGPISSGARQPPIDAHRRRRSRGGPALKE
jgi:hypothetical protein